MATAKKAKCAAKTSSGFLLCPFEILDQKINIRSQKKVLNPLFMGKFSNIFI